MGENKKIRSMSVDNCLRIGEGRSSRVYQIDADTIVKAYKSGVSLIRIQREIKQARKAFLDGIPTAEPFDMVRVSDAFSEDTYGVIFENVDADTIGHYITEHPEQMDVVAAQFTKLLKRIHQTYIGPGVGFRPMKRMWLGWLAGMREHFTEDETAFMKEMLLAVPYRDTMVHCDYHENNVLYRNGELVLIDMADIGYGHPIFDLAGMAFRAHVSLIPGRNAHHGLTPENMNRFWEAELKCYFMEEAFEEARDICNAFGYLRSALFPIKHSEISRELLELHVRDARDNLLSNRKWAMEQAKKLEIFFDRYACI